MQNREEAPRAAADFADAVSPRRGGMMGWGIVLIVVGVLLAVGVLFEAGRAYGALETVATGRRGRSRGVTPVLTPSMIIGWLVAAVGAAGCVWTGIASCQARRWVRPVMMIAAVGVGAVGLMQFVAEAMVLPTLLDRLSDAMFVEKRVNVPSTNGVLLLALLRLAAILVLGVGLPWMVYRFYANPATADLLDRTDQRRLITDRLLACPKDQSDGRSA